MCNFPVGLTADSYVRFASRVRIDKSSSWLPIKNQLNRQNKIVETWKHSKMITKCILNIGSIRTRGSKMKLQWRLAVQKASRIDSIYCREENANNNKWSVSFYEFYCLQTSPQWRKRLWKFSKEVPVRSLQLSDDVGNSAQKSAEENVKISLDCAQIIMVLLCERV